MSSRSRATSWTARSTHGEDDGAFPDKRISGIGGISDFRTALNYFPLGCGAVQVCTAAMLDHAVGPNVIKGLVAGMTDFLERNADKGWTRLEDFRGSRRERVVAHSKIRRPADSDYAGGYESEGYASEETSEVK